MSKRKGNIVIVSNRLPVRITRVGKKSKLVSGSGGLVTALAPVLRDRGGIWIGWDGDKSSQSHTELFKKESIHFKREKNIRSYEKINKYTKNLSSEENREIIESLKQMGYM